MMKKINVNQIKAKGYELALDSQNEDFMALLKNVVDGKEIIPDSVSGHITIQKTGDCFEARGTVAFTLNTQCAHCGKDLKKNENINILVYLAPSSGDERRHGNDEELELSDDDLQFSFFHNDQIEIDKILNDEIALALPYNDYCTNESSCHLDVTGHEGITLNDTTDPRWDALKNLKTSTK